jgi:hypothetical protein
VEARKETPSTVDEALWMIGLIEKIIKNVKQNGGEPCQRRKGHFAFFPQNSPHFGQMNGPNGHKNRRRSQCSFIGKYYWINLVLLVNNFDQTDHDNCDLKI